MSRGTQREQWVEQALRDLNYLTASRRHLEGPGDVLALPLAYTGHRPLLVEVKSTTDYPWRSTWGPQERGALLLAADVYGAEAMLAWWPPGVGRASGPLWLPPTDWP